MKKKEREREERERREREREKRAEEERHYSKRNMRNRSSNKVLGALVACLALCTLTLVSSIEYKCSANALIGKALWSKLKEENGRKELDLSHRLNSKGERYGRVIDFKDSEIRYLELLEDLCKKLPQALPLPVGPEEQFERLKDGGIGWVFEHMYKEKGVILDLYSHREAKKEMATLIGNHCAYLLDEYEEEVIEILKRDWDEETKFLTTFMNLVSTGCLKDDGHAEL